MTRPVATYRLQLRAGFGFREAAALVPYLADLGISTLYASPILKARSGSTHGYDVTDPTELNPELGTEQDFAALCEALRARGMGLLLDIVPNHMAASHESPWWWDVLKHGRTSDYAPWFDIDWEAGGGRVILPVLGDAIGTAIARSELTVSEDGSEPSVRYFDKRFPIAPDSWNRDEGTAELLARQHYTLEHWREGMRRVNYRRFFDIADLVAIRAEDPRLFRAAHQCIARIGREGVLAGVRVDHIDGLRRPGEYLSRLRDALAGEGPPPAIIVEKILAPSERLPPSWPVTGTTGYEFASATTALFVDPAGFRALREHARERVGLPSFDDVVYQSKREVLGSLFAPDLSRLTRLAKAITAERGIEASEQSLGDALIELTAALRVYRTYLNEEPPAPGDRGRLRAALDKARTRVRDPATLDWLGRLLSERGAPGSPDDELLARWQQLSGPAMAKGFEDTALYRYPVLTALNEVGGSPDLPADPVADFHNLCLANAGHPGTLLATSTHDTKRSEDARGRLAALSEFAADWTAALDRWSERHRSLRTTLPSGPAPDPQHEWMLYQAALSIWPFHGEPDDSTEERLQGFLLKAARESKSRTSWLDPDTDYERACAEFLRRLLTKEGTQFRAELAALSRRTSFFGALNSLATLVLKVAAPGVPDFYQGAELWDPALVDPDNRRPVDFDRRRALLAHLHTRASDPQPSLLEGLLERWMSGDIKLWATRRALAWRAEHAPALQSGGYLPLAARGARAGHIVAFARADGPRTLIVAAPRLCAALSTPGSWPLGDAAWLDTALPLPQGAAAAWRNAFDGTLTHATAGALPIRSLFRSFPGALLSPA